MRELMADVCAAEDGHFPQKSDQVFLLRYSCIYFFAAVSPPRVTQYFAQVDVCDTIRVPFDTLVDYYFSRHAIESSETFAWPRLRFTLVLLPEILDSRFYGDAWRGSVPSNEGIPVNTCGYKRYGIPGSYRRAMLSVSTRYQATRATTCVMMIKEIAMVAIFDSREGALPKYFEINESYFSMHTLRGSRIHDPREGKRHSRKQMKYARKKRLRRRRGG